MAAPFAPSSERFDEVFTDVAAGRVVNELFDPVMGPFPSQVEPFSLVFLDPPYGQGLAEKALTSARTGGWLRLDALIVVEEAIDSKFTPPAGFAELERRPYDTTALIFLRVL